jgi:hypothetical protein
VRPRGPRRPSVPGVRATGADAIARDRVASTDGGSVTIAVVLIPTISAVLALGEPRLRHWFLIPVTVCGTIVAIDAVEWLRRRLDVFDPRAVLGLLGVHLYYFAPVLHVLLDRWPIEITGLADWREALGAMALLNSIGLLIYRAVVTYRHGQNTGRQPRLRLDVAVFTRLGLVAGAISLLGCVALLMRFGGVWGYANVVTGSTERTALAGSGWLILVAEALPMTIFCVVLLRWRAAFATSGGMLLMLVAGLALTQFVVAGLRGSRGNTLWPIVLAVILIHLLVRTISRRLLVVFVLLLVGYLYLYGLYKSAGLEVLDVARGTGSVADIESRTGRDVPTLLLGDMARADIQALILDRVREGRAEPANGATYLGDAMFLVPRSIVPDRPPDKVAVGTDVLFGPGAYAQGMRSTRIYGITGEAMMNFGVLGGLASFAVLGLIVRLIRGCYLRARRHRSPLLALAGMFLWPCTPLPIQDLDNLLWLQLKYTAPLALLTCLSCIRSSGRREPVTGRSGAA